MSFTPPELALRVPALDVDGGGVGDTEPGKAGKAPDTQHVDVGKMGETRLNAGTGEKRNQVSHVSKQNRSSSFTL